MGTGNHRPERAAILSQLTGLDQFVRSGDARRSLGKGDVTGAERELHAIRAKEQSMRDDRTGRLSAGDEAQLQARIDSLTAPASPPAVTATTDCCENEGSRRSDRPAPFC